MAIITPPPPTENTDIRPTADNIFCFDNLLPEWIVKWGADQMSSFDWRYGQASYPGGGKFFGQILKDHGGHYCEPWPPIVGIIFEAFIRTKLEELLPDAQFLETKKIIVNGQLPNTPANPHADTVASNMWTLVYHCSDTDGDNLFFDENDGNLVEINRIAFKQGRCVLFPSWYIHQGLVPTDGWRITIAFHMLINSSINQNKFITSVL